MKEVKGNAWELMSGYDALCITTNGFVKKNGECVMGRGIALEAKRRIPSIAYTLGRMIKQKGNVVTQLYPIGKTELLSFPVKHNWWEEADMALIERSAKQLVAMATVNNWTLILIPRPGCGNGKLSWPDVRHLLHPILDDRFHIVSW